MNFETGQNANILSFRGKTPQIHKTVFICSGVHIIGDVIIGKNSSVWYNSVIRGDVNYIRIGEKTNIQDMCMLHVTHDTYPLNIGNNVTVAHSVTLHGCTIESNSLIGIGAIVLDGAKVEQNCLVAAGSLIKENFIVPSGTLVAGVPGKIIRDLTYEEINKIIQTSKNYLKYIKEYRSLLKNS